mmetsp:Transcript_114313/g.363291  ORF Transcript_114313/g.363291 Transcript_114313/m.363291 type:complete len:85 (+) Transcript_114313:44-298(+)
MHLLPFSLPYTTTLVNGKRGGAIDSVCFLFWWLQTDLSYMCWQPLRQLRARTLGIVRACLEVYSSAIASQTQRSRVFGQDCIFD